MKLFKKTLLLLAGLFLIMTIILWVFTHIVSSESLKIAINKQLSDLTSQPTKIEGDISWQLLPKPGIKITKIYLGQGQENAFSTAIIDNLFLNLQITPLIRGKLVFNELKVDGFKIHVNTSKEATKRIIPVDTVSKTTDKLPAKFAIEQVLLTRGNISFITAQRGLTLNNVQVGASHVNFQNGFFPVQMKGNLLSTGPNVNLNAYINFKGRTRLTPQLFSQSSNSDTSVMEGQISIQDLQFNRFKIAKINATSMLKSGQLTFNPLNLTFYHGKSVGDLTYQTSTKKITFNQIASGVNSTSFLKAIFGTSPIKGPMDFSIHGSTVLGGDWQNSLNAKGNITVKDGLLNFVNLNAMLNDFSSKLKLFLANSKSFSDLKLGKQLDSTTPVKGKTPFQLITVEYKLDNNLQLNESTLLQANVLQMKGEGVVSLKDYAIRHRAIVKVTSGDKTLDALQRLMDGCIPLQISGTLFDPVVLPDVQKIAPIAAQLLLKKSLEKPMQQFETQLNSLLDKANLTTL